MSPIATKLNALANWIDAHIDQIVGFFTHWITRSIAAWIIVLIVTGWSISNGWSAYDNPHRTDFADWQVKVGLKSSFPWLFWGWATSEELPDQTHAMVLGDGSGTKGHTHIDFGGQWLMGAMVAHGHGWDLYDRKVQREVLVDAYPTGHEIPEAKRKTDENGTDAGNLMSWFAGSDLEEGDIPEEESFKLFGKLPKGSGGPLYPPIHAVMFSPLGKLEPLVAYRVNQVLNLVWVFVAGLGVRYMTRNRIWCSVAATIIFLFPGYKGAICLSQNPPMTLAIIIWGWALIARDRPIAGGIVWGLLAYKPVWAAAFFLIPLITGRWRTAIAMLATGVGLALATLPIVGVHSWLTWLKIGQEAAHGYDVDENWVFLARDVLSIPRRWLLDFKLGREERNTLEATLSSWGMWATVFLPTVGMAIWRHRQAKATGGPAAAFLLLGAWATCFHFMYYDILLVLVAFFALWSDPADLVRPMLWTLWPVPRRLTSNDLQLLDYFGPRPAREFPPMPPVPRFNWSFNWVPPILLKIIAFVLNHFKQPWTINRLAPVLLLLLMFVEHGLPYYPFTIPIPNLRGGEPLLITSDMYRKGGQPWDLYCVLFLWLWCGWLWLWTPLSSHVDAQKGVLLAEPQPEACPSEAA